MNFHRISLLSKACISYKIDSVFRVYSELSNYVITALVYHLQHLLNIYYFLLMYSTHYFYVNFKKLHVKNKIKLITYSMLQVCVNCNKQLLPAFSSRVLNYSQRIDPITSLPTTRDRNYGREFRWYIKLLDKIPFFSVTQAVS